MNLTERYRDWLFWDHYDYGAWRSPSRLERMWMVAFRWPRFVYWQIVWEVPRLICKIRGHNMEDCSSIGPNSGTEAYECKRCGYSWSHTYY